MDVKHLIAQLQGLGTAAVSDAMDRLEITGQASGIIRLSGQGTIAGQAFTVAYEAVDDDGGTVGDYIDDVEPGSVVVLANAGRVDCTVWGGLLSAVASRRGVTGTVIDGACRDVQQARDLGYHLYARSNWMRTGKGRVRVRDYNVPVEVGGIDVGPGDLIMGDADGVVAVPAHLASSVITVAAEITDAETAIAREAADGARLDEARRKHGYFRLQDSQFRASR
jgi:4-hydroxy-4-methyl-2-oxoglutarate aldolase